MMTMLSRPIQAQLVFGGGLTVLSKSEDDQSLVIAGHASVRVVDVEKHMIRVPVLKSAFDRFMHKPDFRNVMLEHSSLQVGQVIAEFMGGDDQLYESAVDDIGLYVVVQIRDVGDLSVMKAIRDQIVDGTLRAFSIAGTAKGNMMTDGINDLTDLELFEITICKRGKNPLSTFNVISKSELAMSTEPPVHRMLPRHGRVTVAALQKSLVRYLEDRVAVQHGLVMNALSDALDPHLAPKVAAQVQRGWTGGFPDIQPTLAALMSIGKTYATDQQDPTDFDRPVEPQVLEDDDRYRFALSMLEQTADMAQRRFALVVSSAISEARASEANPAEAVRRVVTAWRLNAPALIASDLTGRAINAGMLLKYDEDGQTRVEVLHADDELTAAQTAVDGTEVTIADAMLMLKSHPRCGRLFAPVFGADHVELASSESDLEDFMPSAGAAFLAGDPLPPTVALALSRSEDGVLFDVLTKSAGLDPSLTTFFGEWILKQSDAPSAIGPGSLVAFQTPYGFQSGRIDSSLVAGEAFPSDVSLPPGVNVNGPAAVVTVFQQSTGGWMATPYRTVVLRELLIPRDFAMAELPFAPFDQNDAADAEMNVKVENSDDPTDVEKSTRPVLDDRFEVLEKLDFATPDIGVTLMTAFEQVGLDSSNVVGVWHNTASNQFFVSLGDWASEEDVAKVRRVFGATVLIEAEPTPPTGFVPVDVPKHSSVIAALYVPALIAQQLALMSDGAQGIEALPPEELHLTLAFLGKVPDAIQVRDRLMAVMSEFATRRAPVEGEISGVGMFMAEELGEKTPLYASFDAPGLSAFREALVENLIEAGLFVDFTHGFDPHITLAHVGGDLAESLHSVSVVDGKFAFDSLCLCFGDERMYFPLRDMPMPPLSMVPEPMMQDPMGLPPIPAMSSNAVEMALPDDEAVSLEEETVDAG